MTSNKTIGLVILVAAIWGTIGFKIYDSLAEDEGFPVIPTARKDARVVEDTRDQFPLALNYNDPFLKKRKIETPKTEAKVRVRKPAPVVVAEPVVMIDWSKVEYMGSIYNTTRKTNVALLRFNGVETMAKQGESVDGFKVLDVRKDSCQLAFGIQTKYIIKKK